MPQEKTQDTENILANLFTQINSLPSNIISPSTNQRRYDVVVSHAVSGEIYFNLRNISANHAGRIRNEYRKKHGYNVSLFEVGTSGEIHRNPVPPIDYTPHVSTVFDKVTTSPKRMKEREINYLRRKSQQILAKENKRLERQSQDHNIKVYDKLTSNLIYNGNLEGAVNVIQLMTEIGVWNDKSWVIYLPEKLYRKVV